MATKAELISGVEFLVREARRIGEMFGPEEWAQAQDEDGWKNTQVLAHVAGVGGIVIPFATNLLNADPAANAGAGLDIDALNAGLVGARAGKSVAELVDEIEKNYRGVIAFVESQPEDALALRRTMLGYRDVPLGDLLVRMVVLHGLAHIYQAYTAIGLPAQTRAAPTSA